MTSQQFLVCDSSTLANFKQWAQPVSAFFSTAGWTQSADTGQVNWSSIGAVPGSGAFVFEIWKPGDALTAFYLKVEYGNISGTNCPSLRLTISTATDGAGTPTGLIIGPIPTNSNSFTPPSASTQYECDFSGANNRIGVMMWRNAPGSSNAQQMFSVERSLNSSGSYTSSYVTLYTAGWCQINFGTNSGLSQQSLMFGIGAAPSLKASTNTLAGGWACRGPVSVTGTANTGAFNGSIPFDTPAPYVGVFDFPATAVGLAPSNDMSDGISFGVTLYGSSRIYMPGKSGAFGVTPNNSNPSGAACCVCMRYD